MALSDSKLKSLLNKKQSKRFDIADRDSLSVRVSEFGTITFQYRYRYHDKPSRIALGRYPDISLKQAREKIPELRQLLNDGFNPAVQTKRSKATRNATLDECIDLFMENCIINFFGLYATLAAGFIIAVFTSSHNIPLCVGLCFLFSPITVWDGGICAGWNELNK